MSCVFSIVSCHFCWYPTYRLVCSKQTIFLMTDQMNEHRHIWNLWMLFNEHVIIAKRIYTECVFNHKSHTANKLQLKKHALQLSCNETHVTLQRSPKWWPSSSRQASHLEKIFLVIWQNCCLETADFQFSQWKWNVCIFHLSIYFISKNHTDLNLVITNTIIIESIMFHQILQLMSSKDYLYCGLWKHPA